MEHLVRTYSEGARDLRRFVHPREHRTLLGHPDDLASVRPDVDLEGQYAQHGLEPPPAAWGAAEGSLLREGPQCPDGRVAADGFLGHGGEVSQLDISPPRGQHERGRSQRHLRSDATHLHLVEHVRSQHDRGRVACQRLAGEHIRLQRLQLEHGSVDPVIGIWSFVLPGICCANYF